MPRGRRNLTLALLAHGLTALLSSVALANIDIELRPLYQTAAVDDIIDIGLYAVSDDSSEQPFVAMNAILAWDPSRLELTSHVDNGPYTWLKSWFPDDACLDGVNNPPCLDNEDCPPGVLCDLSGDTCLDSGMAHCTYDSYNDIPFNDGDAFYDVWVPLGDKAYATPEGLLVTTFQFRALAAGTTAVEILPEYGSYTYTRVLDVGEVTGLIGPPSQVTIIACQAPTAEAEGSRYVAVTPAVGDDPVAILVTGEVDDPDVSCVSLYVQADGFLDSTPFSQTPAEWGTVHIRGTQIIPSTTYDIQVDCGEVPPSTDLSLTVSVTTWLWGDVDNSGGVDNDDILLVADAMQGIFPPGVTVENVDQMGCQPNGIIDMDDLLAVSDALQGVEFPCPPVCPAGPDLEDYALFYACLTGPAGGLGPGCEPFDLNDDGDVDLDDFRTFLDAFAGP